MSPVMDQPHSQTSSKVVLLSTGANYPLWHSSVQRALRSAGLLDLQLQRPPVPRAELGFGAPADRPSGGEPPPSPSASASVSEESKADSSGPPLPPAVALPLSLRVKIYDDWTKYDAKQQQVFGLLEDRLEPLILSRVPEGISDSSSGTDLLAWVKATYSSQGGLQLFNHLSPIASTLLPAGTDPRSFFSLMNDHFQSIVRIGSSSSPPVVHLSSTAFALFLVMATSSSYPTQQERLLAEGDKITAHVVEDSIVREWDRLKANEQQQASIANALLAHTPAASSSSSSSGASSSSRRRPPNFNGAKWCAFHQSVGHDLEGCGQWNDQKPRFSEEFKKTVLTRVRGKDTPSAAVATVSSPPPAPSSVSSSESVEGYISTAVSASALAATSPPRDTSSLFLDSGASHHMANSQSNVFSTSSSSSRVRIGDNSFIPAISSGTLRVAASHGPLDLPGTLLVPSLGRQLLSVSKLVAGGPNRSVTFDSAGFVAVEGARPILDGVLHDGIYLVNGAASDLDI